MRIYKGRIFFKFEKSPFYGCGVHESLRKKGYQLNVCLRAWRLPIPFTRLYLSKRQYVSDLSDEIKRKIFDGAVLYYGTSDVTVSYDGLLRYTITNNATGDSKVFYEETYKFFAQLGMVSFTDDWQVLYDYSTEKFYGYSHRGSAGFGIGDMLFDETNEVSSDYYCGIKKYRDRFIKRLKYYNRKNDADGFYYLNEEGIVTVIPFRERGRKKIETLDEAFEAASNFAKSIS